MHDTKLIRAIRSLDRKELTDLQHFCRSGFVSINEKAESLLRYILAYKPDFKSPRLKKEMAFEKLFKNETYDDIRMRLLISDTLKLVNCFIGIKMITSRPLEFEILQLEHFNIAENNDFTLKRFEEFRKKIEALPYQDEHYFYLNFRLEELKNNYYSRRSRDYDQGGIFEMLEGFYFLTKLKMTCIRLSHQYIFRNQVDEIFMAEVTAGLKRKSYLENPVILGYSYAFLLLTGTEPEIQFDLLYHLLEKNTERLSLYEQNTFSKILENHCIRQINSGIEHYYELLYSLLERRLLHAEEIKAAEVKTFITLCLRMSKPDIANRFIHEKKNAIVPTEIREDVFNYTMALFHFHKKQYDDVLQLLQQIEYLNVFYKIDSKKLLIQTFYELQEWDSLESAMNAFRVLIHRNSEISDLHKKNNQNFINFLYKLVSSKSTIPKRRLQLQQQLKRSQHIAERKWLMEKVGERIT